MSVHIIGVPFSNLVRSVLLCCEEKNIPYSLGMQYHNEPIALKSRELIALNPMGKIPVLIQDDFCLSETQSIMRYLDAQFPTVPLQGTNNRERALIDQWCAVFNHQTDLIFVRNYLLEWAFPKGENGQVRQEVIALATPAVEAHLGLLSASLGNKTYWVGEALSLADLLLLPMLDYLLGLPVGPQLFAQAENLSRYTQRLRQRPSSSKILQAKPKG
ncbi:MAG: glutathione S-transferase family protein [Marinagarivorans sp.]